MKHRSLKYLLLFISCCLLSRKLPAQTLPNPGDDPIKVDSANYMVSLKRTENHQLDRKKNKEANKKTSEKVQLIKTREK